ncbi:sirohydrochlorin chelatase [Polaromonas sp. CT11-55]|uniref:sirohydrochlorin chelatase n=1 Tax=Polaromonas sp. CT11-55 TaxID=3243045 RepID=UPI0039A5A116
MPPPPAPSPRGAWRPRGAGPPGVWAGVGRGETIPPGQDAAGGTHTARPPPPPEAAAELAAGGAQAIRVFPLFFGVGKHAREDLPRLVAQIQADHPGLAVELLPTAGEYPELMALMASIALA